LSCLTRPRPAFSVPFASLKIAILGGSAGRAATGGLDFRLQTQDFTLPTLDFGIKVLGLTGGVGMGKSTAATLLAQRGVTIVDTDLLARQLVERGQPALDEIRHAFGADVMAPDGSLRRDQLARRVFSDPLARKTLEDILHPRIRRLWQSQLTEWRAGAGGMARAANDPDRPTSQHASTRFFCVVIPLLFETQADREVDATLCVACSSATQHQRLSSRGWNAEQINQRIKSQLPIEEKMARADYVVWNEGTLTALGAQLDRVLGSAMSRQR
jgi:dephospho-CoA kinase